MRQSNLEKQFEDQLRLANLFDGCEAEYRFHPTRKWRFDFAWPEKRLAVELDGVVWMGRGRHQTPTGMRGDCDKGNEAIRHGWRVLHFMQLQVRSGEAILFLRDILEECDGQETAQAS